jgi:hypothetical protein
MTRIAEPQLSFADLELRSQGIQLDPHMQVIADFLDSQRSLIEQVRQDSGARAEETQYRSQWPHPCADVALAHPHAHQELGLS